MEYGFYVDDFENPIKTNGIIQGYKQKWFWFDNFDVYWAYRRLQARKLDEQGFLKKISLDDPGVIECTNYEQKYANAF